MSATHYNVLFLCTGNSARSIFAEASLRRAGLGRFTAWSAGSRPRGSVHPHTTSVLKSFNFDTTFARSKSWEEFSGEDAPAMDFIITVCNDAAGESCPVWPGQPATAHWGVADPASVEGTPEEIRTAFSETFHSLNRKVLSFSRLPIELLDGAAMRKQLDAIARQA